MSVVSGVTPDQKTEVLRVITVATKARYPLRWTDSKTSMGDFSGRDSTLEVFNIPMQEQLPFLKSVRDARQQILTQYGVRITFVFHSPEATAEYYGHLAF